MMSSNIKNTKKIGNLGEDIACRYLISKNYSIICRNYAKKFGEIDIVSKKNNKLYFIEVKTVTRVTNWKFSRETSSFRPEEKVNTRKVSKIHKVIEIYLKEKKVSYETEWQFDVLAIIITKDKKAFVKHLENIV